MLIIVSLNYVMRQAVQMDPSKFQKMAFLYNAVQDGWTVSKRDDSYIFKKKHEGKRAIFLDTYLNTFITNNSDVRSLLSKI
jgi:hypothetical protein